MSARVKHLYRVTATYPDRVRLRDYQTYAAAHYRATLLRDPVAQGYGPNYPTPTSVTITESDPITWPMS